MIDEEDLLEMYAAFEEGLHWDGEWTANLLIEYRELSTEVKRLRKQLDAATLRASLAIECHPNADDMLQELIE